MGKGPNPGAASSNVRSVSSSHISLRTLIVSQHLRAAVDVLSEAKGSSCERTCERVSRLPARLWYLLGLSN